MYKGEVKVWVLRQGVLQVLFSVIVDTLFLIGLLVSQRPLV